MPKQRKALSLSSFHKQASQKPQEDVEKITVNLKGRFVPFGVFVIVYKFLSHHDVKQASLVNKFFHAISEHQGLWQELFIRKAEVVFVEGTWKKFFNADKDDKQANWKAKFVDLDKNLNKDESFYAIKSAHQGCKDSHTQDDRKSRMLPLTGLNNLHFGLQGTETIPKCLIFSSSRPTVEGSLATLKVWSVTLLSQLPHPLRNEPFDLLCRGPHGGVEGVHNPSPYVVHHLATREIGANVTKMYPVYTYFKELENTWEYAAIGGDDMGQVAFYTGLFSDGGIQSAAGSHIFKTNGKVVGLKCILEEQGFSGFKQAYGCGFNDSGQLYDLQSNQVIATFPHEEGINTDSIDVSVSGTSFVLGQVQRKNNQQQGMVRLVESSPAGPQEVFSQQTSLGPVKCVKFVNGSYGEPGDCFVFTSRDGLSLWDKRVGKAQLKYATNAPLDQLAIISSRQLIACTCGPDLMLWDMRGCRPIRKLAHGHQWCSSIACDPFPGSPTTGVIITGGTEGGMRLWQVSHLWQPSRGGGEDRRRAPAYGRGGAEKGDDRRSNGVDTGYPRGKEKGGGGEADGTGRAGRGRGFDGGKGRGRKGGYEPLGGPKGNGDGAELQRGFKGGPPPHPGKGQAAPVQWPLDRTLVPPPTAVEAPEDLAATHVPTGAPNPNAGPQPYRPPLGSAMKMPLAPVPAPTPTPTPAPAPTPAHAYSGYAAGKGQQAPPGVAGHPYPTPSPAPTSPVPSHGYPHAPPLPPHMYPGYSPTPAMPYGQSSYMPPPSYYAASPAQPHSMQPPPPGYTAYSDPGYLSAGWVGDPDSSAPAYSQRNGANRQYWTG